MLKVITFVCLGLVPLLAITGFFIDVIMGKIYQWNTKTGDRMVVVCGVSLIIGLICGFAGGFR